ncbi:pectate lyase family protein [Ensifer adhaerens]
MKIQNFILRMRQSAARKMNSLSYWHFTPTTRRLVGPSRGLQLLALLSFLSCGPAFPVELPPTAVPGAEGHGKMARGGRGGRIILVTNLDDAGPGSLRECIEGTGPRNCVFRVAGVIRLKSSLVIGEENQSLSILGQTSPGGGISLTINQQNAEKKHTPLVALRTQDVIVRHLRIRPALPNSVKNVDGVTIEDSKRVYFDHNSVSWATDENINTYSNSTDVTIANSIFAEGLNKHSKCALLGSDPRVPQNITFWGNACISNNDRNPDNNHYATSCIDIINNVFFNARSEWGEVFSQYPGGDADILRRQLLQSRTKHR